MKWILETGHGEITEDISDYSGNKRFLLGGIYIGRGVLREKRRENGMELWLWFAGGNSRLENIFECCGRLRMRILLQGRSEIQDEKEQATR